MDVDITEEQRAGPRMRLTDPMVSAVLALGITQITAWGTSYYCLGVLAGPISQDTGWSRGFVFLGFTVALLAMGLVSSAVGRAVDRHGARAVMTLGTVVVSSGLFALAHVRSEAAYLAVWAFLGLGMRLCLYDAAFAALVQIAPSRGRTAISYLTLFGAFASSVFWVVGHALNQQVGWRQTLVLFALINLVVCLPLHWLGLARRETADAAAPTGPPAAAVDGPPLEGRARSVAIVLFALIMSLNGFVFGVISVQLVPLLEAAGLATAAAVWVASMKGVAQFGGRVVEILFARNLRAITVGRIAVGVLPPSLLLLLAGTGSLPLIVAFTLLMGASQGVITIVRGAVPLVLFGAKGYGAVLGVIATPVLVVNAASPTVFAWVVDRWGWGTARVSLLASCSAAWLAMELMSRWYERRRAAVAGTGGPGTRVSDRRQR
ncbi:MAG TPA: MFS transporter [Methylomirabilota bacterium]|nr:MFS transporter [Methylomirabilota bacterium]